MTVTATTPTATAAPTGTSTTASPSTSSANTVDYNTFLKLLVAEIKNQDPTSPTDPTQYLGQLASFSSVGQSVQTNAKLDLMLTSNALSQAEGAIGRTVTSADGGTAGVVTSVAIGSDGAATATLQGGGTLKLGSGVTLS